MNILIAIDDSAESRDAVTTAFELFGSDHHYSIVSVAENAPIFIAGYPSGGFVSSLAINEAADRAQREAERVVAEAVDELPVEADPLVDAGPTGATICRRAKESGADILVVGSHDRSFWERFLSGPSVGSYLVEHSPCPVLVVRSE